jgi:hypothetical protein
MVIILLCKNMTPPICTTQDNRWRLMKHRDVEARRSGTSEKPEFAHSALSGRTMEEIALGRSKKTASAACR